MIASLTDSLILVYSLVGGADPWPQVGYLLAQIALASSQIAQ